MLQAQAPDSPPDAIAPRRYARLREVAKFALIANAVACTLLVVPLTLAAAYHVERTGRLSAGPAVWRVLGLPDAAMVASLLLGAATPPLLISRRRKAVAKALAASAAQAPPRARREWRDEGRRASW